MERRGIVVGSEATRHMTDIGPDHSLKDSMPLVGSVIGRADPGGPMGPFRCRLVEESPQWSDPDPRIPLLLIYRFTSGVGDLRCAVAVAWQILRGRGWPVALGTDRFLLDARSGLLMPASLALAPSRCPTGTWGRRSP
jgi:hypothetical protein